MVAVRAIRTTSTLSWSVRLPVVNNTRKARLVRSVWSLLWLVLVGKNSCNKVMVDKVERFSDQLNHVL